MRRASQRPLAVGAWRRNVPRMPSSSGRGGQHGERFVDARQFHGTQLRLHLLQQRGRGLGLARGRVEVLAQTPPAAAVTSARAESVCRDSSASRAFSSFNLRFSRRKNACSGASSTASGWSIAADAHQAAGLVADVGRGALPPRQPGAARLLLARGAGAGPRVADGIGQRQVVDLARQFVQLDQQARHVGDAGGLDALDVARDRGAHARQARLAGCARGAGRRCATQPAAARRCPSPAPAAAPAAAPTRCRPAGSRRASATGSASVPRAARAARRLRPAAFRSSAWRAAVSRARSCACLASARASIALVPASWLWRASCSWMLRQLLPEQAAAPATHATARTTYERAAGDHDAGGRATAPRLRQRGDSAPRPACRQGLARGLELIETILGPRPRRPRTVVTRKQHRSRRRARPARCADAWPPRGRCAQSWAGQQRLQVGDGLRAAEQPDARRSRRGCGLRHLLGIAERRCRAHGRPSPLRTCAPAARKLLGQPVAPAPRALARRRRARSARARPRRPAPATCLPQRFRIELRRHPAAARRPAGVGTPASAAPRRVPAPGRPGTRVGGQARSCRAAGEEMPHRVGADEHHGAHSRPGVRQADVQAAAGCASGTIVDQRQRHRVEAALRAARRPSARASLAGRVTITRMARAASVGAAGAQPRGRLRRPAHAACAAGRPRAAADCARTSGAAPSGSPQAARSCRYSPPRSGVGGQRHRAAAADGAADRALGRDREPGRPGAPAAPATRSRSSRRRGSRCPARPARRAGSICSGSNDCADALAPGPGASGPAAASTIAS